MKKSLYICNATNPAMDNIHTKNTALGVFSGVTSVIRCGFVAKLLQGVRSLFVHTRKTCYTMRQTNKQAMKAKNSNLSRTFQNITIGIIGALSFPLMLNDSEYIGINFVGIALLMFAGYLHHKWEDVEE